jgi:4-aminobutyrate aminotransferase-like enzyme
MQLTRDAVLEIESRSLAMKAPGHDNVVWSSASGATVTDSAGRQYIDFSSGVLVANTGHCHPKVVDAIKSQAERLLNCYDAPHPLRGPTGARLLEVAGEPFDSVALLTTGAEAIDAAVKAAKAYKGRYEVISFSEAFHGKSISAASLSGMPGTRRTVGPVVPGSIVAMYPTCYRCPLDLEVTSCGRRCYMAAAETLRTNSTGNIAAIIVEPYLGAGGAYVPPKDFWHFIRDLATEHDALVIFDEVQSSFGRTGTWFAFQQLPIVPDILVVAKGIASGMPMSAVISRKEILQALPQGVLGSTYGGNPLACAAALATADVLESERLIERSAQLAKLFTETMQRWPREIEGVGDVRGMGLSLGIDLVVPGTKRPDPERALATVAAAAEEGVIVLPPSGSSSNVVRMAPPFVLSDEQAVEGLARVERALRKTGKRPDPRCGLE